MNPNFLGGIEIGTLLAVILLGMVTVQIYVYYANFPHDSRAIKALIAVVWFIETAHVAAICYGLYRITITRYGHLDLPMPMEMCTVVILGNLVHPLVQAIFTARICQLGSSPQNRIVTAVCWAFSGFVFGVTVLLSIKAFSASSVDEFQDQWDWLILSLFGATAAVDLLIAATMGCYTAQNRTLSDAESSNKLDTLILWTAPTGLLTSTAAVAVVIVFATMRRNHLWLALLIVNTGLYSNSLLSLLNGRLHLGYQTEAPFTISLSAASGASHRSGDQFPPAVHMKPSPFMSPWTAGSNPTSMTLCSHAGSSSMLWPPSLHSREQQVNPPRIMQETV